MESNGKNKRILKMYIKEKHTVIRGVAGLFTAIVLFFAATAEAQTAFPALGGDETSATCSISFTVGQLETQSVFAPITNAEISGASMNEGVQQTYRSDELNIEEILPSDFSVAVYPNPTTNGMVTIEIPQQYTDAEYELFAANGRMVKKGRLMTAKNKMDISGSPAGTYVLREQLRTQFQNN